MRLIDADALKTIRSIQSADYNSIETIQHWIDNAPTIDAVPVVRCKDCRWWNDGTQMCGITISATPCGHCHDGERKDDE